MTKKFSYLLPLFTIAQPSANASTRDPLSELASPGHLIVLLILGMFFYLLPTIVALRRRCKASAGGIIILNLLLGWTVIGWIVALVWAASAKTMDDEKRQTDDLAKAIAAHTRQP